MPWGLVRFLVLMTVVMVFIGYNLENVTTISVGFASFERVPVFVIIFASFVLGAATVGAALFLRSFRPGKTKQVKPPRKKREKADDSKTTLDL